MESDTIKLSTINSNGGNVLLKQLLLLSKSVMVSHSNWAEYDHVILLFLDNKIQKTGKGGPVVSTTMPISKALNKAMLYGRFIKRVRKMTPINNLTPS